MPGENLTPQKISKFPLKLLLFCKLIYVIPFQRPPPKI